MNPATIKAVQGVKKFFANKTVLAIIVTLIAFLIIRRAVKKTVRTVKENQFDKNEFEDPNLLAQQYRSASNPSGYTWMIDWDGTDESSIKSTGYQTKGQLDKVSKVYKQKFGESLTDRLRTELDASDFDHWKNIVK